MDILRQFNKYSNDQRSLVQKAMLTAATGVGEALVPQHLEKVITSTIVRLAPEIAVIVPRFDAQKLHEFNRLTALPTPMGMMGEGAVTPTYNSTYARASRQLKVIRRKGAVTNFLQDSSKNYIDAAAVEMENHLQAHVYDLVAMNTWGNDGAGFSAPGLDELIASNRVQGGTFATPLIPTDLSLLDDAIDRNIIRQGINHKKVFLMSPQMLSKYSRLLTNVRLNQGLAAGGLSEVEIPGGWRLQAYRDVPIIQTTQMRPTVVSAVGTFTATKTDAGGSIPATQYWFVMSTITWGGEQLPTAESTCTPTGGTSVIAFTWTADPTALFYKFYGSKVAAGAEKLFLIIPAYLYDAAGTVGAACTQCQITTDPCTATGNPTIGQLNTVAPVQTITASVPTAMLADVPIGGNLATPAESIILWDLDEFQGMGKFAYTNSQGSRFNGLVTTEPLAKTDDNLPFLIKTYGTLIDSWEATSIMYRNLKIA
jgi:hypothetical protein